MKVEFEFAMWLCGHNQEMVEQLYQDWLNSLTTKASIRLIEPTGINHIDNWEVYGSNSGCTGIISNHPNPGDESVCLKNKITNEIKYIILGK